MSENKKEKKHEKILSYVKKKRLRNAKYCEQNDCTPTEYMRGSNDTMQDVIDYIERL
jgi:hypothetical protein